MLGAVIVLVSVNVLLAVFLLIYHRSLLDEIMELEKEVYELANILYKVQRRDYENFSWTSGRNARNSGGRQ